MTLMTLIRTVSVFILFISLLSADSWSQSNPDPKLIEGAKKEGQLVYYTTMTLDQSKQTVDRFEKKYPFIKVTLFRTGGGPLLNKIFTESRGGRHDWDVGRGERGNGTADDGTKALGLLPFSGKQDDRRTVGGQGRLLDSLLCE